MPTDTNATQSDYYGDAPDTETTQAKPGSEHEQGQPTAVLPKSILAGKEFQVGESVVLKIVAIHDDEIVVEYDYGDDETEKRGEGVPEMAQTKAPGGEMTSMFED